MGIYGNGILGCVEGVPPVDPGSKQTSCPFRGTEVLEGPPFKALSSGMMLLVLLVLLLLVS